jgi:hypothetical protein
LETAAAAAKTAAAAAPTETKANPAVAGGRRAEDGVRLAHTVTVLTLARGDSPLMGGRSIRRISAFREPSLLAFGRPGVRPVPVG